MNARPAGVSDDDVRGALSETWRIDAASLDYAPVGAGSYHWIATNRAGERFFVTVDDLDAKPWLGSDREVVFAALRRCYESAQRLHDERHLEFVVAPVGGTASRLSEQFTVALFPLLEGRRLGRFDTPPEAGAEILELLARLHGAGDAVRDVAPTLSLEIPERAGLRDAMATLDQRWTSGPLAEDVRAWLGANAEAIECGLRSYEALAQRVSARSTPVITHGEPHAGNFMRVNGTLNLVDWDTVAFAPPERDLWLCCRNGSDGAALYRQATGRAVDPEAINLFTIRWDLADIASYIVYLRHPHTDSEDTRRAIDVLRRMDVAGLIPRGL